MLNSNISGCSKAFLGLRKAFLGSNIIMGVYMFIFASAIKLSSANDTQRFEEATNELLNEFGFYVSVFIGISMLISLYSLIVNFIKLAGSSGNPSARSEAIKNLLVAGLCTALLGGIGIIQALVYFTSVG